MKFDSAMISVLLATIAPVVALVLAIVWDRRQRKQIERPPQSEKLLRPPGYSPTIRLDEALDLVIEWILIASTLSAFSSAGAIAFAGLLGAHAPVSYVIICLLVVTPFVAGSVWAAVRAFRLFKKAQNIRLGLRGEQAVAEALGEAADSGFRAFHDLQTDRVGNLDHVAAGTRGVYLIETKARRNAAWLSDYLRNETGEPVEVFPLVVLPGWFVKKSERGNFRVEVMAAKYLAGFLERQAERIEPAQVRHIKNAGMWNFNSA